MADTPEITVARFAAHISVWALAIAGGSFVVTAGLFFLEVRRWFDEGVRLSLSIMLDAEFYGGPQKDDNTYLAITVTNRGSAPTTLTHMVLYDYPGRFAHLFPTHPKWLGRRFKRHRPKTMLVPNPGSLPLPYLLEPGRNWHGQVIYTPDLERMIAAGHLRVGVVGSHSGKALLKPARRWETPTDTKVI